MTAADALLARLAGEGCRAFLAHWLSLPREGAVPLSRVFLDRPPAALMPHVMIQELWPEGLMVRFMGTALVERWQHDITGRYLGESVPAAQREQLYFHGHKVATHPCGLHQIGEVRSSTGRTLAFEAVILPLGAAADRPPRLVSFSEMALPFGRQEHTDRFMNPVALHWLDLGAGVPDVPTRS
jgi:hypothetical protein